VVRNNTPKCEAEEWAVLRRWLL